MHAKILFVFSAQLNFLLQQKIPVRVCLLVGVERFELPHVGIRIRSLTTWLHPKNWNQTIALILQVHLLKL